MKPNPKEALVKIVVSSNFPAITRHLLLSNNFTILTSSGLNTFIAFGTFLDQTEAIMVMKPLLKSFKEISADVLSYNIAKSVYNSERDNLKWDC